MTKTIQSIGALGTPFGDENMRSCIITFTDGSQGNVYTKTDPPWFKVGDEVEWISKNKKTKREPIVDEISVKRLDAEGGGGHGGGGYQGGGNKGGSKGGNESFALAYAKDIAVALIEKDVIKDMDTALSETEKGFKKLIPLLQSSAPKQEAPKEDPKWVAAFAVIKAQNLQEDIKKLGWKKHDVITQWDKDSANAEGFTMSVKSAANPPPADDDLDDIPF